MDFNKLEIIIQLCRLQVQREREKLMTPKLRGVRSSMDKLRHAIEADADKLALRVDAADAKRSQVFAASHGAVSEVERDLREVEEFLGDLSKSNGGDPLEDSEEPSNVVNHPRSSEVSGR